MSATITDGTYTMTPETVRQYSSTQDSQTLVHPVLGRQYPYVTFRPAAARTGTLALLFEAEDPSEDARHWFATRAAVWMLNSPERPSLSMSFIVQGTLTRERAEAGYWEVTTGFHEVEPGTSGVVEDLLSGEISDDVLLMFGDTF